LNNYLNALNIVIKNENSYEGKKLFIIVMKSWLSGINETMNNIVTHLPSPLQSQKYRTLYSGPQDDKVCNSIFFL
jgi:hypothetical protein